MSFRVAEGCMVLQLTPPAPPEGVGPPRPVRPGRLMSVVGMGPLRAGARRPGSQRYGGPRFLSFELSGGSSALLQIGRMVLVDAGEFVGPSQGPVLLVLHPSLRRSAWWLAESCGWAGAWPVLRCRFGHDGTLASCPACNGM
jgi:hypothetical protein